jgi:tetratricopeptide (TPR) repeat protein
MGNAEAGSGKRLESPQEDVSAPYGDDMDQHWYIKLVDCLRLRRISEGMMLLDQNEPVWQILKPNDRYGSEVLLMLAQWVDVGHRDPKLLRRQLDGLTGSEREGLGVFAYIRVRLAEGFYYLSINDADGAISILDSLLRFEELFLDSDLRTLANLWKGRAHRKKADYEKAREHISAARRIANTLSDSKALLAIITIQQAWLLFQYGDSTSALQMLAEAQAVLGKTDHWIALGNIESARGRIVRRRGDYADSVVHFEKAVALYEINHPNHPNLARTFLNFSFVKRLLASQLKKHIDATASGREKRRQSHSDAGSRLRELHQQYQELYRSAIAHLERAKQMYSLRCDPSGLGSP